MNLTRKSIFFIALSFLLVGIYGVAVFADENSGGYTPGESLNPTCAPGAADCLVVIDSGTPGGADTYVQYNDGGVFGGDSNFTWDKNIFTFSVGDLASTVHGTAFYLLDEDSRIIGATDGQFLVTDSTTASSWIDAQPASHLVKIGDASSNFNQTLLTIDDSLQTINGFAAENITFGSVGDTAMLIDVANNEIAFQTDGEFNVTGTGVDNDLLTVDFVGQTVYLGDHDGGVVGNDTVLLVDDLNQVIVAYAETAGVGGRAGVSATSAGLQYSDGAGVWSWFADETGGGRTGIQAGTNIWSWPNSFGNAGEALVDTDGAGTLGWAAVGGGGMSIGDSIGGDVEEGALLFVGGGDVLANDDDLLWVDPTTKTFSFGDLPGGVSANGTLVTLNDDTRNISALVTVAGPTDTTQLLVNTSGSQLKYDTAGSQNSFIGAFSGYSRMSYSDGSFSSLVNTSSLGTSLQFNGISASSTVGLTDLYASMSWTDPILGSSGIRGAEGELRLFNNDGAGTTAIWYWPTGYGNAGEALVDTDGNGTLGWAAVASGNVTGSGTSPRIPYWSSASALTDDADFTRIAGQGITLWDNSTNNNIFINGGNATTNGSGNIAIGSSSGTSLPAVGSGNDNVLIGKQSGTAILTGGNNVILGTTAGATLTDGTGNVFVGDQAGRFVTNTNQNVMVGFIAGFNSTSAATNTFVGNNAATANTTGDNNVALGSASGITNETGNNNTMIGASSGTATTATTGAIALGYLANAASNQFALPDAITTWKFQGDSYTLPTAFPGTNDFVLVSSTTGVMEWKDKDLITSDENLKSNIVDLGTDVLSKLRDIRTVTYTLNSDQTDKTRIGFIAQDLEQYFPELVNEDGEGYKGVYYAQMTPVLVEAIRELDLKITEIQNLEDQTFKDKFIAWLGDVTNGIQKIFTKEIQTEKLCIGTGDDIECIESAQELRDIKASLGIDITPDTVPDTSEDESAVGTEENTESGDVSGDVTETPEEEAPVEDPAIEEPLVEEVPIEESGSDLPQEENIPEPEPQAESAPEPSV